MSGDRPRSSTTASKPPSLAATPRQNVSEVWRYFTKLDGGVLLCNTCKKEVCRSALRRHSTSPAWEHLRVRHREVFESTEFFKQRQATEVRASLPETIMRTPNRLETCRHIVGTQKSQYKSASERHNSLSFRNSEKAKNFPPPALAATVFAFLKEIFT